MTTTAELRESIISTHARFTDAFQHLDDEVLETEPALGIWPVREVAGHLAAWNLLMLAVAREAVAGQPASVPPITDFDGFNAESAQRTSQMSWAEVTDELGSTIDSAVALVDGLSDEQLEITCTYPWGQSGALPGLLHGIFGHEQEHIDELQQWLQDRSRGSQAPST